MFTCPVCGAAESELPTCFFVPFPEAVAQLEAADRAGRVDLGEETCVLDDTHYFIRANLHVPVHGWPAPLTWTVWSSLSQANFDRALDLWSDPCRAHEPPYFSWLNARIPGYADSLNLKAQVHSADVGVRPSVEILDLSHALAVDQRQGVSQGRALELVHAALHGDQRAAG